MANKHETKSRIVTRVLWGLALVAGAVVMVLNALNVVDINIFFKGWWTLLLIIPSVIGLLDREGRGASFVMLVVGVSLLLAQQEVIDGSVVWKLIVAAILVVIGVSLLFKGSGGKGKKKKITKNSEKHPDGEIADYITIFSGRDEVYAKEKFAGCSMQTVFGGMQLNLKDAIIEDGAEVSAKVAFGGVRIIVPEDTAVEMVGSSSFCGGVKKDLVEAKETKNTLRVEAHCAFGGIEITNKDDEEMK